MAAISDLCRRNADLTLRHVQQKSNHIARPNVVLSRSARPRLEIAVHPERSRGAATRPG